MNRREFLKTGLTASALLFLTENSWTAKALGEEKSRKRLVVILLRGAVDGLNVIVPYSASAYYSARPTIAIPRPNENGGVLPLDSHFGLHPALAPGPWRFGSREPWLLCTLQGRPIPAALISMRKTIWKLEHRGPRQHLTAGSIVCWEFCQEPTALLKGSASDRHCPGSSPAKSQQQTLP